MEAWAMFAAAEIGGLAAIRDSIGPRHGSEYMHGSSQLNGHAFRDVQVACAVADALTKEWVERSERYGRSDP
jgi:hypothetical protein